MKKSAWIAAASFVLLIIAAWAVLSWWADRDSPPILPNVADDDPRFERIIDAVTVGKMSAIGGESGGFWYGDAASYYWIHPGEGSNVALPGFAFKSFPKQGFPFVDKPFGLYLADSDVTDADLDVLAKTKNLKVVNLRRTRVTEAGVARLREALPSCQIDHP